MAEFQLQTDRLMLRDWLPEDLVPFAAMSADPAVMATLGPLMTQDEAAAVIGRLIDRRDQHGHTFWALERREDARFIGFCGIIRGIVDPIANLPEVGWRLASVTWGRGYAREAAIASLNWGFDNLPDDRIWAITSVNNDRSWGLMERLGMTRHADMDFDHPNVADGSPLKPHITYSIRRDQWTASVS